MALAREENDHSFVLECEQRIDRIWAASESTLLDAIMSEPMADAGCFVEVHSGTGGTDSMDWCRMLGDMYTGWSDLNGLSVQQVGATFGDVIGYRNLALYITGQSAFGLLAHEMGTHRLIRNSPFDRKCRRHTSFAVVWVIADPKDGEANGGGGGVEWDKIPRSDLRIETMRASGAGGQSVNMSETAVRATHLPSGVSVKCQRVASQIENRNTALKWLSAKLHARAEAKSRRDRAVFRATAPDASAAAELKVRTYTLNPREMVKDHRSGLVSTDATGVLSGDALHPFLERGTVCSCLQQLGGRQW